MLKLFKRKLLSLGSEVLIDAKTITAVYPDEKEPGFLVIRFAGIGVMRVNAIELYGSIAETVAMIQEVRNGK